MLEKTLVLFRGVAGAGKSTEIERLNLKPYVISSDKLRMMLGSLILDLDGNESISNMYEAKVWQMLESIVEHRLSQGLFTVVDATHITSKSINRYKAKAKKYGYAIVVVDLTDIPLEVVKRRNRSRIGYKRVPESAIDTMYIKLNDFVKPVDVTFVTVEEFEKMLEYKVEDFSRYTKVHHIGDIHGCNTVLQEYLQNGLKEDEMYIFLGDYIDRGIENAEVLEFLLTIYERPNVRLLKGNHELHLGAYLRGEVSKGQTFETTTTKQIDHIDKEKLTGLYNSLRKLVHYMYDEKNVICTHGGLSGIPEGSMSLVNIPEMLCVKGVGYYEDMLRVNLSFMLSTPLNYYQVHGHRNEDTDDLKINEKCYNLTGQPEQGKDLKALVLDHVGFKEQRVTNTVYDTSKYDIQDGVQDVIGSWVEDLRKNEYIRENKFGNISSFNFKNKVFYKDLWNEQTTKARGLFINTNTNEIVARSYDKFFNLNERPETEEMKVLSEFKAPISIYEKENGYLGILGYDSETDELLYLSKSQKGGEHSELFRRRLQHEVSQKMLNDIKKYLKVYKVTMLFEVIDIDADPHIIEYNESKVVLLDIIYNTREFMKYDYDMVKRKADEYGLNCKVTYGLLSNEGSFLLETMFKKAKLLDEYKHEGFVIEDATGKVVKVKTQYYKFWKALRGVVYKIQKGEQINYDKYQFVWSEEPKLEQDFKDIVEWMQKLEKEDLKSSIIQLRNSYMLSKRGRS